MPKIPVSSVKMLREALCSAQSALNLHPRSTRTPYEVDQISEVIRELDKLRPLGVDGKHGNLHTEDCGCLDKFITCPGCGNRVELTTFDGWRNDNGYTCRPYNTTHSQHVIPWIEEHTYSN